EDRPGRDAVRVGHHFAHAGAGIADRAPDASALDDLAFVLRIGPVLRTLEILEPLPTRLRAAERLPVEFDIEPLGDEETLLMRDEIVKAHAFRGDRHRFQAVGHGILPELVSPLSVERSCTVSSAFKITTLAPSTDNSAELP